MLAFSRSEAMTAIVESSYGIKLKLLCIEERDIIGSYGHHFDVKVIECFIFRSV